jgi:nifR3 family TIM-barrel protein
MKWKIGNIEIDNQVGLAPMAGISNPAYMQICEEMGVGWAVTELISAEAIVRGNQKTLEMLNGLDNLNIPVGVQIFGSDAKVMAASAQIICNLHQVAMIDINMGCPVPKVATRAQAGSALLKSPEKVYEIVSSVKEVVSIPVTVKIRSGWDANSINAVEIAKQIEKAGASAITIHPRTRSQGYSGKADWNIIKMVKETVSIPVIGNGDIKNCFDAKRMLEETGCDAIMIGRASLGNPWLIKECVDYLQKGTLPEEISVLDKFNMIKKHLNNLKATKSEKVALLEIRSHIAWYLKGVANANELKMKIFKTKRIEEIENLLNEFLEKEGIVCIPKD